MVRCRDDQTRMSGTQRGTDKLGKAPQKRLIGFVELHGVSAIVVRHLRGF